MTTDRYALIEDAEHMLTELYWYSEGPCDGITPAGWKPRRPRSLDERELIRLNELLQEVRAILNCGFCI